MTHRLDEAFDAVPRISFLPANQHRFAHEDRPIPIGYTATNSQPSTVRYMLEQLDVHPGDRVLDVGSGSGWTTALLGHLVASTGKVIGVDIVPALVEMGRRNLGDQMPWVHIELSADGVLGWPADAPYDKILVSADGGLIPAQLEDQLAVGGRLVLPSAHRLWVIERSQDGKFDRHTAQGLFSFVPLR